MVPLPLVLLVGVVGALIQTDYMNFGEDTTSHNFQCIRCKEEMGAYTCGSDKSWYFGDCNQAGPYATLDLAVTKAACDTITIQLEWGWQNGIHKIMLENDTTTSQTVPTGTTSISLTWKNMTQHVEDGSVLVKLYDPDTQNLSCSGSIQFCYIKIFCTATPPTGNTSVTWVPYSGLPWDQKGTPLPGLTLGPVDADQCKQHAVDSKAIGYSWNKNTLQCYTYYPTLDTLTAAKQYCGKVNQAVKVCDAPPYAGSFPSITTTYPTIPPAPPSPWTTMLDLAITANVIKPMKTLPGLLTTTTGTLLQGITIPNVASETGCARIVTPFAIGYSYNSQKKTCYGLYSDTQDLNTVLAIVPAPYNADATQRQGGKDVGSLWRYREPGWTSAMEAHLIPPTLSDFTKTKGWIPSAGVPVTTNNEPLIPEQLDFTDPLNSPDVLVAFCKEKCETESQCTTAYTVSVKESVCLLYPGRDSAKKSTDLFANKMRILQLDTMASTGVRKTHQMDLADYTTYTKNTVGQAECGIDGGLPPHSKVDESCAVGVGLTVPHHTRCKVKCSIDPNAPPSPSVGVAPHKIHGTVKHSKAYIQQSAPTPCIGTSLAVHAMACPVTPFGSTCSLTCKAGYVLHDRGVVATTPVTVACIANGSWDSHDATCVQVSVAPAPSASPTTPSTVPTSQQPTTSASPTPTTQQPTSAPAPVPSFTPSSPGSGALDAICVNGQWVYDDTVSLGCVSGTCSNNYVLSSGDIPGDGKIHAHGGGESVASCDKCGELCSAEALCWSYECSPGLLKCNLNNVTQGKVDTNNGDYIFCTKACQVPIIGHIATLSLQFETTPAGDPDTLTLHCIAGYTLKGPDKQRCDQSTGKWDPPIDRYEEAVQCISNAQFVSKGTQDVASGVITALSAVASAGAMNAVSGTAHSLKMLSSCASRNESDKLLVPVEFIHASDSNVFLNSLVTLIVLAAALILIHGIILAIVMFGMKREYHDAAGLIKFPNVEYMIWDVVAAPMSLCCFQLIFNSQHSTMGGIVTGGLLVFVSLVLGMGVLLHITMMVVRKQLETQSFDLTPKGHEIPPDMNPDVPTLKAQKLLPTYYWHSMNHIGSLSLQHGYIVSGSDRKRWGWMYSPLNTMVHCETDCIVCVATDALPCEKRTHNCASADIFDYMHDGVPTICTPHHHTHGLMLCFHISLWIVLLLITIYTAFSFFIRVKRIDALKALDADYYSLSSNIQAPSVDGWENDPYHFEMMENYSDDDLYENSYTVSGTDSD